MLRRTAWFRTLTSTGFVKLDSDKDPMEIAERLIKEYRVAVLPGTTFGIEGCYLRIAYGALKKETVAEGMGRLVEGLGKCIRK